MPPKQTETLIKANDIKDINNFKFSPQNIPISNIIPTQPIPKKSALIKTDKPRPHVCLTCTRAFARLEHLKRHERSHTNEKPYQCAACGRCFARRDLVLRHQQKLHSSLPSINRRIPTNQGGLGHPIEKKDVHINVLFNNTNPNAPLANKSIEVENEHVEKFAKSEVKYGTLFSHMLQQPTPQSITPPESSNKNMEIAAEVKNIQPNTQQQQQQQHQQQNSQHQQNQQHHPQGQHHRHASFSASSSTTYLNNKEAHLQHISSTSQNIDAPHQVGFATPQLSAMDMIGIAERTGLPNGLEFGTGFEFDNLDDGFTLDGFELNDVSNNGHVQLQGQAGEDHGETYFNSGQQFTNNYNVTPGGSIDIPILQQFLHIGSGGGGAGFDNDNFNLKSLDKNEMNKNLKKIQVGNLSDLKEFKDYKDFRSEMNERENFFSKGVKSEKNKNGNNESPNDWLQEFITPYDIEFPIASHHIGFTDSPTSSIQTPGSNTVSVTNNSSPNVVTNTAQPTGQGDDIPSLFRSRQIDLFKQIYNTNPSLGNSISFDKFMNDEKMKNLKNFIMEKEAEEKNMFTESIRNNILSTNNLSNLQFPPLEDLNSYYKLYHREFDQFFPFVHLSSLENMNHLQKLEHIPLLLSICSIGALYSFHSKNSTLLFNISRYQIHFFMERHHSIFNFNNVPLWVPQSLVLHIFLGMFNNSSDIVNTTSRQMNSLVGLIKSTSFNLPLEQFMVPPPTIDQNNNQPQALKDSYEYFVLAQSRIRTVHTLYMISVLRSSLIGSNTSLEANEIQCGTPCNLEELWNCSNPNEWFETLGKNNLKIDSKFSLIEISNGEPFNNILNDLDQHYCEKKLSFKTLLTLLMSIKDKIYIERVNSNTEINGEIKAAKWRLNSRPLLESLLKSWELFFIRNGGFLVTNESNLHLIKKNPVFKIILPLISLSKIRLCVALTPIMERIWYKDWNGMNEALKLLDNDPEALRESTGYSLDIIKLWIDHISIINNAEKTSVRTPIFFVTCIFTAILIIADYLYTTEIWADKYSTNKTSLNAVDRVLWLRSETLLKQVERNLLPKGSNNSSYSEFLRMQANGALDVERMDDELAQLALEHGIELKHTAEIISRARLSSRALSLGVRILADAPVWPVAMGFAEALKARAIHISKLKTSTHA